MRRTPYESAAAPTSHSVADPAEFNVVCRSKSNLPNRTDSNAALLPYLTHQLGSAHEWSGVWNGPKMGSIIGHGLARVVQRMDNAIHRINRYPADSVVCFVNTYLLDSDLSAG